MVKKLTVQVPAKIIIDGKSCHDDCFWFRNSCPTESFCYLFIENNIPKELKKSEDKDIDETFRCEKCRQAEKNISKRGN
jgi:hypothetical protein